MKQNRLIAQNKNDMIPDVPTVFFVLLFRERAVKLRKIFKCLLPEIEKHSIFKIKILNRS